ncbi:hypothetical protein K6K13_13300 [Symbiopectobacterium purcellii]|uniref:Uncharacterized protein n=1 Tax=Symbiopectobacterium purcellii TaxID=2871826 RepID=A0ABX9AXA3_9ENTR|nr:hypothetical protein K6K13_13300 [Symbiopectobacterium purcellii]
MFEYSVRITEPGSSGCRLSVTSWRAPTRN